VTDAEADLIAGAGGAVSSTHDLPRWVALLLGYGSEDAEHAVPAHVLDVEVLGPQALIRLPGLYNPYPRALRYDSEPYSCTGTSVHHQ
jgi:CubicO group peptidase (beta-lactamase class C family)